MRPWIVGSVVGHIVLLFGLSALTSLQSEAQVFGEIILVDLQMLELPEAEVVEEPPPKQPDEIPVELPDVEPELPAALPEPVIARDPVPPTPEMPPEPKVETKKPEPIEDPLPDLPEPQEVRPETRTAAPELSDPPAEESAREALDAATSMRMRAPEGMVDYYYGILRSKIARRWNPSNASARGRRGVEAVISFRVGAGGGILDVTVLESSGLSHFDRLCERAVLAADPLPKPPARYLQAGSLPIELIFSLNP
jgi:TonB family protein